jgi:hypothetical protein
MKKWLDKLLKKQQSISEIIDTFSQTDDFVNYKIKNDHFIYCLSYLSPLVDKNMLHRDIITCLKSRKWQNVEDLAEIIDAEQVVVTDNTDEIMEKMLSGYVLIHVQSDNKKGALVRVSLEKNRDISIPEVEVSVVGPKEAFVEPLDTNLNLIRKRLPIKELKVHEIKVGKLSKTRIAVIWIEGIADHENVKTVTQRIKDIDIDVIADSSYIAQIIADNQRSLFPQMLDSERPDRVAAILAEGKVAVLVDGSPHALIGPTTLVEFFSSFEDYFLIPYISSFFRLIRLFSVGFSIMITPVYVAVLSYHYELIPKDLLSTLVTSRREVPLPPILEALFLELTIELLREAGARLPTKVGQTIGIVGGIVIGTASVEAGLTSNVLLIIVALAALASFTTPVYKMGNTIRLLRFPFLLFAELWGLIGIVYCFCILMTHLLRLTSLGRPFLEPIYPPRVKDFKDAFIRLPFSSQAERPVQIRSENKRRFDESKVKKKKDIDE